MVQGESVNMSGEEKRQFLNLKKSTGIREEGIATGANTIVLAAAKEGYYYGYVSEGYPVYQLYKNVNLIGRIAREICFRIPVLPKAAWYDKTCIKSKARYLLVNDTLVTRHYLKWLRAHFPTAQINFIYNNMVGNARHLKPDQIPNDVRVWTYDEYDSQKYGIRLKETSPYFPDYVKTSEEKKYDLFFVGRDKGRGEKLLKFEKWLNAHGVTTYFIITRDGRFKKTKPYYKKEISYDENVRIVAQSRAVLNVTMKNQRGITLRDLECLFNRVKLITTNKYIVNADFYNPNNIFILGVDDKENLSKFIAAPYDDSQPVNMDLHSVEAMVREVTGI